MNDSLKVQWVSSVDDRGRISVRAVTAGCVMEVREELSGWSVRLLDPDGHSQEAGAAPTLAQAKQVAVAALQADLLTAR